MSDPIQRIKNEADIVELISEIIPVKKSGANYLALCPFHNDSKPSMYISPSKQIFKCFACDTGGDVFKFWSEYYQKDFKDTLKDLAQKYGIELNLSPENKEATEKYNLKIRMHEMAAKFYHEQLLGSEQALLARTYIDKRQIDTKTITEFKLGFAPIDDNNWSRLTYLLKTNLEVSEEQIVEAGLALKSEKTGKYYDRFRGRLMIPIMDDRSRVIAFGARSIPGIGDSQGPKYINSPETSIYNKGSNLFGINLAKESIRKEDAVIIVEGYFDLISLYQSGITNVLANQGTALTSSQVKVLSKYSSSKRIYLCFDSDNAGRQARDRAIEVIASVLNKYDYEIRILEIPDGKDADDYVRNHGAEAFRELINKAPLLMDYKIDEALSHDDINSPQAKAKAIKFLAKYLSYINNQIELSEYLKIIASRLKIDEHDLAKQLENEIKTLDNDRTNPYETRQSQQSKPHKQSSRNINGHMIYIEDAIYAAEQEFITLALNDKAMLERFMSEGGQLISSKHQRILEILVDISFENPDLSDPSSKFMLVSDKLSGEHQLSKELADIGIKLERADFNDVNDKFNELLRKLKESRLKQQINELKKQMQEMDDSSSEWEEKQKLKHSLEREIQSLKQAPVPS